MFQTILCCIQGLYSGVVLVWVNDMQLISTVCPRLHAVLDSKIITTININHRH